MFTVSLSLKSIRNIENDWRSTPPERTDKRNMGSPEEFPDNAMVVYPSNPLRSGPICDYMKMYHGISGLASRPRPVSM